MPSAPDQRNDVPPRGRGTPPSRRSLLRYGAAGALVTPVLAACGSTANPDAYVASQDYDDPKRGGRLRVGVAGGSSSDTVDAHNPVSNTDIARVINLNEGLCYFDVDYSLRMGLAESVEANQDGSAWTVRLRSDLEFHNGKTITADDVKHTLLRVTDPDKPGSTATQLAAMDRNGLQKLDERTLRIRFDQPVSNFTDIAAQYAMGIVPEGYDPAKPVGAGPFAYSEFTPGVRSMFTRHDNYWRENEPHLDELEIINYPDDTARVNALIGGQVDAVSQLPHNQIAVIESYDHLDILESETGMWVPFTMRVDQEPFDDVRVRQAFRLIVDREQMINQALSGHGAVANDLYARFDPAYNDDLPQRGQDIGKARELLAEAGYENGLEVELVTAPISAGAVQAASVFKEQAKKAGVTVNLRRVTSTEFFGDNYLKWTFAQSFWNTRNYLSQAANGSMPDAAFNETHWDDDEWTELVTEARTTMDDGKRTELLHQAQRIEHERGGYIIWGFANTVDGFNANVNGFEPSVTGNPLSSYGFRRVWFAND
ncbi:peptide/nickel transport system substrate-binding protein [Haloactinospora alba]|uniref:Peptide/nickel transport system substrate-binding protein n=1 Tax=Haloactinospora alba TaxID=405555 RepID=A0A543NKY3_9ACTN|nr:ABC transporter substrate-binding protein [Haloactinospora alba]TQN32466.1 peptide/nickel transport system substrate-binding protein [Haloactinospora alba]